MNCDVCNKPSGFYPLCKECNILKEKSLVTKCKECKKWYKISEGCNCNKEPFLQSNQEKCLICDSESKGKLLCFQCYKEKERLGKELLPDRSPQEIKDHYFNQKRFLYKVKNPEYTKTGMLKMVAISEELSTFHRDWYLKQRLNDDINKLRKYQEGGIPKDVEKEKRTFDDEDFRKQFLAEHQCEDGHYVRSYSEMLIDNWLYNHGIIHAYEKSVFMATDPDAVVLSDFYIPKGKVYIEFWGLKEEANYIKRKV